MYLNLQKLDDGMRNMSHNNYSVTIYEIYVSGNNIPSTSQHF